MPQPTWLTPQDPDLDAKVELIDPKVLEYAILRERDRRSLVRASIRETRKEARKAERAARPRTPEERNVYRKLQDGELRRKKRPYSAASDRRYVAAALRHWRLTHDLSPVQAQAKIGLSPNSCAWRHYEDGFMAPPYLRLLQIIAATGLGTLLDRDPDRTVAPELLLDARQAEYVRSRTVRRNRRRPVRRHVRAPVS